jgi:cytochrome c biogenesis protein CcmG/thiol:disulfide interchange protein DsbE
LIARAILYSMRRWIVIAGSLAIAAAIGIGIVQSGGDESGQSAPLISPDQASAQLHGAPPRLAQIHAQSSEILGGGKSAYQERVRSLRGLPIVVNVWGSWCPPCREEMPLFNRVSAKFGKRVAFLGVDTDIERRGAAEKFLRKIPVYYPSYKDEDGVIANTFGVLGTPSTIFYDRAGRDFSHQGQYRSEQDLTDDIERYALGQ